MLVSHILRIHIIISFYASSGLSRQVTYLIVTHFCLALRLKHCTISAAVGGPAVGFECPGHPLTRKNMIQVAWVPSIDEV